MKKSPEHCDCVTQVNDELEKEGQKLCWELSFDPASQKPAIESPLLRVEWIDKPKRGKRLPTIVCSYCPFCGKKKP